MSKDPGMAMEEECEHQRKGEDASDRGLSPRFLEGLDDAPELKVLSTHSGSMTQETFLQFAMHFVNSILRDLI